jgi:hypothetical protein
MQEGRTKKALAAGALGLYLLVGLVFGVAYATIQELSSTDFFTSKHGRSRRLPLRRLGP